MLLEHTAHTLEPTLSGGCGPNWKCMAAPIVLHGGLIGSPSVPLLAVLALAAAGTAVLLGLAIAAYVRRQSRPYLLIVAALAALLARSAVAGLAITGTFSPLQHHLVEHGLDVVLVGLVIAAVYHSRTVSMEANSDL